jgi:hypothetical protein
VKVDDGCALSDLKSAGAVVGERGEKRPSRSVATVGTFATVRHGSAVAAPSWLTSSRRRLECKKR